MIVSLSPQELKKGDSFRYEWKKPGAGSVVLTVMEVNGEELLLLNGNTGIDFDSRMRSLPPIIEVERTEAQMKKIAKESEPKKARVLMNGKLLNKHTQISDEDLARCVNMERYCYINAELNRVVGKYNKTLDVVKEKVRVYLKGKGFTNRLGRGSNYL